ncbi:hypothetical protein PR048_002020 [Dryococelus australis]|uniref:Uncharacterized protein n=1 Tax=Dryococelus australis TaxID=614101 RepID=A0ABQ9IIZ1_9NEOP|nr:hypothetical protein PR048_002020 [Dryococelus australis]
MVQNKQRNATEKRLRIIETAVVIIRQGIQSHVYNKTTYPPGDHFLKDASTCVPTTLLTFLEKVTVNKTKDLEKRKRKCISIAHSCHHFCATTDLHVPHINQPRFIAIQEVWLQNIVNILSSLGFCSSYYEVQLLEMPTILHTHPNMNGSFSQFVFDNTDFNACTIDQLNILHAMGGIRCTTPEISVVRRTKISRLTEIPSSKSSGELGVLPLEVLGKMEESFDKMLQRHAFARAVRAHLLIQTALSNIILEQLDIDAEERKAIDEVMTDFQDESPSLSSLNQNPHLVSLAKKMENKLTQLKKNGLTAILWVLYFKQVTLVKEYIHAEGSDEIATGVVGDNKITYYDALAVGKQVTANMFGKHFIDVKLSRKDRALPLASTTCSVKMYDAKVVVDAFLIFQRISISKQTNDDLKTYLQHESDSFPLDLFDEAGMRKTKKCAIYDIFEEREKNVDLHNFDIVMDGEYLLHKVGWRRGPTCLTIYQSYLDYILKYYSGKSCTVVFDGYSSTAKSTKDFQQIQRYRLKKSKHTDLQDVANVFNSSTSPHNAVAEAGNRCSLKLYRALGKETSLNLHHYHSFTHSVFNAKSDISVLLPTEGAAKQHSFRVYHQVQLWLGNELPPELWGWGQKQYLLMPVTTEDPTAPGSILNVILQVYHWL